MDSTESDGLFVSYDEEAGTLTFSWNEHTHPQWNALQSMSHDEFRQLIITHAEHCVNNTKDNPPEISSGGPSCGTSQSNLDAGFDEGCS